MRIAISFYIWSKNIDLLTRLDKTYRITKNYWIGRDCYHVATTNTSWTSGIGSFDFTSCFGVASCFSSLSGFFKKQFIINMWKKILPLVSVQGGSFSLPDFPPRKTSPVSWRQKPINQAPLRPIVDYTSTIGYSTSWWLADILGVLVGKTVQHVQNSKNLAEEFEKVFMDEENILNSHDVVSLFTNTPIDQVLYIVKDRVGEREDIERVQQRTKFQLGKWGCYAASPIHSHDYLLHLQRQDFPPTVWYVNGKSGTPDCFKYMFGLVGDVPPAAWDPYPCSGVNFPKKGTHV